MTTPQLMLIPGLGAKAVLFTPQRGAFDDLVVPEWLTPQPDETIRAYAERWATQLQPRRPLFIGGMSFGGMVALELARVMQADGVFLIASCRDARYVNPLYRAAGGLARFFPAAAERWLIRHLGGEGLSWLQELNEPQTRLIQRVADDVHMPILRWGGRRIVHWRYEGPPPCPVYQVHGARDDIIRPQLRQTDLLIPNAKHLINLTHPAAVNRFIRTTMQQHLARRAA